MFAFGGERVYRRSNWKSLRVGEVGEVYWQLLVSAIEAVKDLELMRFTMWMMMRFCGKFMCLEQSFWMS